MSSTALLVGRFSIVELRLLFRRPLIAMTTILVPLGLGFLTWLQAPAPTDPRWGAVLGERFLMLLILSVYLVSTIVVTARRQALVLKRLRTSELTDTGVLAGILAPIALVALGQAAVLFAICLLAGAPLPAQPLTVIAGVVAGIGLTVLAGLATATLTRTVELAQLTTGPLLIAALAGMYLRLSSDPNLVLLGLAMPLTGPLELVSAGWAGSSLLVVPEGLPDVELVAVGGTALWVALFGVVIHKAFRWEPRS
ncbi:hypothetical protein [Actinoalloteichus fjordicus]|uniref:ABC-2 type transport system permease protein n=1 Tax=Actinoalloteichus fjordicus TaxID=1612552 RepID=A0AAC9L986_9PSEU|nr:hypothetical protein [Actinoalloteichus fjordicus]APU12660.1 hypothetical protein UA74_02885 [Actinoalloteichus fjordicus]